MKRKELATLVEWKHNAKRKPLIINGLRQVGKTWLLKEFGARYFDHVAYLNLETSQALHDVFTAGFDLTRILSAIEIETGVQLQPGKTLLILDEIQTVSGALLSLKYFYEQLPDLHVACAGSLLGIALGKSTSFPVGKVQFLDLHPLNFPEYLEALREDQLLKLLHSRDWPLINTFSGKYQHLLRQYYYTGGMPEVLASFREDRDVNKVREIQQHILRTYELDFAKHAPEAIVPRIRMLWHSLPAQLAKENKKFIYRAIRPGARSKDYELALLWLIDSGLVHKINNLSAPQIPLKMYEDREAFKLYTADVGLLCAMVDIDAQLLLHEHRIFEEFKGALTEQYVLQQLASLKQSALYYWSPYNAQSEIDFVFEHKGRIWPLEVKAEENLQAKSLKVFYEKYQSHMALRTSMSPYRRDDWIVNIPLFAVSEMYREVGEMP